MEPLLLGMISMGSAVAALLFLRFWRSTQDRFFLFFAAAFFVESINRFVFATIGASASEHQFGYVLARLAVFVLILIAILDKNVIRKAR
ncbi:DUF5985 family protein [Noviluteimonas gilva]|uniref:Uncharacterized protein n=1 Tax=Noviluteimonas gilva TaxID=2682097 RepID=A0A7C9HZA9_9GAMM|nr:DUF5985 family protein [Lysobacter gilvus]MUV14694.1 hypothetical protein [Lysobacter gilvus]